MVGKRMSWKYDFISRWLVQSETKSSYWHLNFKKKKKIDDVIFTFVQLRLSRLTVINFLPDFDMLQLRQFSTRNMIFTINLDDVIIVKFSIKGGQCIIFHICVLCLWEVTFFTTWICMTIFFDQYLGCYSTVFFQILVCCSWDYGLS